MKVTLVQTVAYIYLQKNCEKKCLYVWASLKLSYAIQPIVQFSPNAQLLRLKQFVSASITVPIIKVIKVN